MIYNVKFIFQYFVKYILKSLLIEITSSYALYFIYYKHYIFIVIVKEII